MNDEIKEILESSRKIIKSNRENGFDRIIMLGDDIDKLLDYITNLQKEFRVNNDLIPHFKNRVKELKKEITNLQKENDYYFKKNNELSTLNISLRSDRDDYKSRVEKAVEYIKGWQSFPHTNCTTHNELKNLLNILQNGSDNNV